MKAHHVELCWLIVEKRLFYGMDFDDIARELHFVADVARPGAFGSASSSRRMTRLRTRGCASRRPQTRS